MSVFLSDTKWERGWVHIATVSASLCPHVKSSLLVTITWKASLCHITSVDRRSLRTYNLKQLLKVGLGLTWSSSTTASARTWNQSQACIQCNQLKLPMFVHVCTYITTTSSSSSNRIQVVRKAALGHPGLRIRLLTTPSNGDCIQVVRYCELMLNLPLSFAYNWLMNWRSRGNGIRFWFRNAIHESSPVIQSVDINLVPIVPRPF